MSDLNVSVIICVPRIIKDNRYSIIDTVTEPMQCNISTGSMVENTNKLGAYMRVEEEDESQRLSVKMVDNNNYNVEFVDKIQQNQMIGDTPNYCIPLSINAITVQGISYSDPYFSSFNLKYNKMAFEAPEFMNKSDYAFKNSVCNVHKPISDETQLLNKAAQNVICETNETRMIVNGMSGHLLHDNKSVEDTKGPGKAPRVLGGPLSFDALVELVRTEDARKKVLAAANGTDSWGAPRGLRLCGGGESSLNAASGWGSPPSSNNAGNWGSNPGGQANNAANNTQQQWNNTAQRPPTSQADGSNNGGNGGNSPNSVPNTNGPAGNGSGGNGNSTSSAKIEQLNSMREALYSQDGWGGQHVNQDTNWDVPGSPEPGSKPEPAAAGGAPGGGPPTWKPNINNGTDLWEANLRNGGQPPPQPASKTPWGHTPTTNIGGTWGEDDEPGDGNVWSGGGAGGSGGSSGGAGGGAQWAGSGAPPPQAQQWRAPKKDDWNAWGEPPRAPDMHYDRGVEPRPPPDPRHDLRGGISGRLNGDMWQHHHQQPAPPPNKMMPSAALNQWPSQGPKDSMKGGWEEPSPPAARRAAAFDEGGTSLWGQRGGMAGMGGRGGPQGPPAQQRAPPAAAKPEGVWGAHAPRNGSWEEPHTPSWGDREGPGWDAGGPGAWPAKPKTGPAGWPEDIGEWGGPKGPAGGSLGKQIPKDVLYGTKQFRYLVEMGYKKEEAEAALRSRDMNAEEALELLASAGRGAGAGAADAWRRGGGGGGAADEFAPAYPPPGAAPPPQHASPAHHKLLQPPPHQPPLNHHHHQYNPAAAPPNNGQPSTAQLRMLVQQIQMAVTAGYLNHQILNQPLAPQTLVLLNQLLQQIKVLQQLVQQHTLAISKANSSLALQYQMQINKAKQQITGLQNQIATQQALYMKQQSGGADIFKQGHDALAQLQNNFGELNIAKEPQTGYGGGGNQQSRLNQWKLPSLDKEIEGSEFSRAPGSAKSTTSPQMNQLGLQSDTTWGVRGAEGWGSADGADVADGKDAWPHAAHVSHAAHPHPAHQPVYDLVPEFEPGKPWKGHQMKTVEDDPAMTPGSMVRSPLSLTVIKDVDMFAGKTSPPGGGERSLSSSTWSYAPPAAAGGLKAPADTWGGGGGGSKARAGAGPPGLNKAWPQHHTAVPPPQPAQRALPAWQASTWLLLKNLTAQIDGSTLKTLCLQHGPLQNFHLYLIQGIALARYSSREEAAKAQMALNNCVLGNTTIFAESPAESDVQALLQHLSSGGGGWRGGGGGGGGGAASKDAGAWGAAAFPWPDSHDQRGTPSSLNSFLPQDLLGSETI